MKEISFSDLEQSQKDLLDSAEAVMRYSYSPYSKFSVGAAVLSEDGEVISGTNFENASYGITTCAERAAIVSANSKGKSKLKAIAIIAKNSKGILSPCGQCRQIIQESALISKTDIEVIMSNNDKSEIMITKISELLPLSFGLN